MVARDLRCSVSQGKRLVGFTQQQYLFSRGCARQLRKVDLCTNLAHRSNGLGLVAFLSAGMNKNGKAIPLVKAQQRLCVCSHIQSAHPKGFGFFSWPLGSKGVFPQVCLLESRPTQEHLWSSATFATVSRLAWFSCKGGWEIVRPHAGIGRVSGRLKASTRGGQMRFVCPVFGQN